MINPIIAPVKDKIILTSIANIPNIEATITAITENQTNI